MHLLFVCSGNTCRSPMAEGIFKKMTVNLENFVCSSAGMSFNNGAPVSENAAAACLEIGIDISHHHSRSISFLDTEKTDWFVVMTYYHAESLLMAEIPQEKIYILNGEKGGIPDPYGSDMETYRRCRDLIVEGLEKLYVLVQNYMKTESEQL